jgi:uncharacterized protein HemX
VRFDDLGLIVVPLLILLLSRVIPLPEDEVRTEQVDESPSGLVEEASPEHDEVVARESSAATSGLAAIAQVLVVGGVGYAFVLLLREIRARS